MVEKEGFLMKPKHQFIYPNEQNEFMVPNHSQKRDYYVNLHLSNKKMNFNSKTGKKRCFSYETKASISFISMMRMCLWCLIIKRKKIIM